ncbi:hypothetical protein ACSU1N_04050 [Thermogladius sp. 4427co]|uniref:hypothetical protein n=1 Tax=Thermogladius sp. 4427co TaxID=3450718 RepID=UPI003F79851D
MQGVEGLLSSRLVYRPSSQASRACHKVIQATPNLHTGPGAKPIFFGHVSP